MFCLRARMAAGVGLALLLGMGAASGAAGADAAGAALPPGYAGWLADLSRDGLAAADTAAAATARPYPWRRPESPRWEASRQVRAREAGTPGSIGPVGAAVLAAAEDYRLLGEYGRASDLYLEAARLDTALAAGGGLAEAALAAAVAADDSARVVARLLNTIGASDLAGREGEVVLAYRWLLGREDTLHLDLLNRKVEGQGAAASPELRYWRAFALSAGRDWPAALAALAALVGDPAAAPALGRAERLWVATAIPDLLVLTGATSAAAEGYRMLAASEAPGARSWALYQMANLDFLAGRYAGANAGYRAVCALPAAPAWQPRACALAALTDTLGLLLGARAAVAGGDDAVR